MCMCSVQCEMCQLPHLTCQACGVVWAKPWLLSMSLYCTAMHLSGAVWKPARLLLGKRREASFIWGRISMRQIPWISRRFRRRYRVYHAAKHAGGLSEVAGKLGCENSPRTDSHHHMALSNTAAARDVLSAHPKEGPESRGSSTSPGHNPCRNPGNAAVQARCRLGNSR